MQLAFGWSNLLEIITAVFFFISGIRDFKGKDPLINLPFNQYNRDPEYRAFWQKKNGIFYMFNGIVCLLTSFISAAQPIGSWLLNIAIVVDIIYLIAYEIWEHSAD